MDRMTRPDILPPDYDLRPAHAPDVVAWVDARPQGASTAELREVFCDGVALTITRCLRRGVMGYIEEPHHGRGRFTHRRYFTRKHCPPGAILEPLFIPPRAIKAALPAAEKPKPKPRGIIKPEGEEIRPEGVKVTVWQAPPDPRRVVQVTPFFSVGKRVQADTPIQRYYGAPGSRWGEL